jgi:DNA repair protein RecN (Recombination protein N)
LDRKKASQGLEQKIEEELKQLGMLKVGFQVNISDKVNKSGRPVYTATGKDQIRFLISPNQGEPFKPLTQIASGGELSRIMLAIKSILAESDQINSLIFDEVDAGIGGEVALAVGERLKHLSDSKQVLCITHLATLAARADNHIEVEKIGKEGRTLTRTARIEGERRLEELARMLAGDREGEVSRRHAVELLEKYGSLRRTDGEDK